jgi:hypothetical protein
VEAPAWRAGTAAALEEGLILAMNRRREWEALAEVLVQRFRQIAPPGYRAYMHRYDRQTWYLPIEIKALSFWQWRTCERELAEVCQAAEILACVPGRAEEELRSVLLIPEGMPNDPRTRRCARRDLAAELAPQYRDGWIEGWRKFDSLATEGIVETIDEFADIVEQKLIDVCPDAYRQYVARYWEMLQAMGCLRSSPGPMLYRNWRQAVAALAIERDRRAAAGQPPSIREQSLCRRLLCRPEEATPSLEWRLSPELAEQLTW